MDKKFHSKDIVHLYDETYFLGGKSKHNGQVIGVEGYQDFKKGKIYQKKIDCANMVDFKDKNVLDIGFGRGETLKYCIDNGAKSCVGIDYAESALKIAKDFIKNDKVKLYHLCIDEIGQVEESGFDVVYMHDVLEHCPNEEWDECFKQLLPKLNKGCVIVGSTPSTKSGPYLQTHNNYHSEESLNTLLSWYFKEVKIENKNRWYYIIAKV